MHHGLSRVVLTVSFTCPDLDLVMGLKVTVPYLDLVLAMGLTGVVLTLSFACLYLHDNQSFLPCPGACHGSDRCGADTVTVFMFMTVTLPYLALVRVMGLTGVVLTLSLSLSS